MADKEKKHNLYTAIAQAMIESPHIDTGNNDIYTVLGLKPKKVVKVKRDEKSGGK